MRIVCKRLYLNYMLVTHIIIAILSLAVATIGAIAPSRARIVSGSTLVAGTLISGVVLVFQGYSLAHVCISGLAFTTVSMILLLLASSRLAKTLI